MSDVIITKEDLQSWNSHPVTKVVRAAWGGRILDHQAILGRTAGIDPLNDRFISGYIAGLQDAIDSRGEIEDD